MTISVYKSKQREEQDICLWMRGIGIYTYVSIYKCVYISAVKISALTYAINFSSLTALKIFNAVNTGAELGLATPFTTVSFFLDKNCIYLDAESLYDNIRDFSDVHFNFASAPALVKRAQKRTGEEELQ